MEASSSNKANMTPPTTDKEETQNKPIKPLSNNELRSLIQSGDRAALNTQDQDGNTPLLSYITHNNNRTMYLLVRDLITAGADVNIVNNEGESALILAFKKDDVNTELVKVLLQSGADPTIKDRTGSTALIYATKNGLIDSPQEDLQVFELVKLLLKRGSDIFEYDNEGNNIFYNLLSNTSLKSISNNEILLYVYKYARNQLKNGAIVNSENYKSPLPFIFNLIENRGFFEFENIFLTRYFTEPIYKLIIELPIGSRSLVFTQNSTKLYFDQFKHFFCYELIVKRELKVNILSAVLFHILKEVNKLRLIQRLQVCFRGPRGQVMQIPELMLMKRLEKFLNEMEAIGYKMMSSSCDVISPLMLLMVLWDFGNMHKDSATALVQDYFISRGAETNQYLLTFQDARKHGFKQELDVPDALCAAMILGNCLHCIPLLIDYWPGHPLTLILFVENLICLHDNTKIFTLLFELGGPLPSGSRYIRPIEECIWRIVQNRGYINVPHYILNVETLNDFRNSLTVVPSLQVLSRHAIRSCFRHGGKDLPARFNSLPLPDDLCTYVARPLNFSTK